MKSSWQMYTVKVWAVSHVKVQCASNISQILSLVVDVMSDTTRVISTRCSENNLSWLSTDCKEQSFESCGKSLWFVCLTWMFWYAGIRWSFIQCILLPLLKPVHIQVQWTNEFQQIWFVCSCIYCTWLLTSISEVESPKYIQIKDRWQLASGSVHIKHYGL